MAPILASAIICHWSDSFAVRKEHFGIRREFRSGEIAIWVQTLRIQK